MSALLGSLTCTCKMGKTRLELHARDLVLVISLALALHTCADVHSDVPSSLAGFNQLLDDSEVTLAFQD